MSQLEIFAADQSNDFAPGPPRRSKSKDIVIALPADFLPCTSDHESLRVMADMVDDAGNGDLAGLLRWTANAWKWGHGMSLEGCRRAAIADDEVWIRFHHFGWSRGYVKLGPHDMPLATRSNWRRIRRTRTRDPLEVIPSDPVAWWDVEQGTTNAKKPKPRKGFTNATNVALAWKLAGISDSPPKPAVYGERVRRGDSSFSMSDLEG